MAMVSRWRGRHKQALLIVDQFEELFTLNAPEIQDRFAGLLRRLVDEADVHVLEPARDDRVLATIAEKSGATKVPYRPIVKKRSDHPFGDRQRQFQLYRRGRYVEFNLVYDRGTIFGVSVALSGELAVVGAPGDEADGVSAGGHHGAAYVFRRDAALGWARVATLGHR